ncbi:desulfoferrodoxin [Anaeromassilibacillus senegalensis]|uniref:Desulfoferrodoxin n=1 Tax=Anaeromassilibacillus senegalensis TaxID=1673717 RepID=A0ABS9MJ16_9FIRM|nr:desulfoferrodoxin family protein [Anaeromassilibacillus senegalensis]MCG4610726.1 desulfoferrodoxin [Anaeromassilibacillus senegalensis]
MSKEVKFYICKHCGNIVGLIHDSGVPLVCCGEKMSELVPNTTEGATEKHLPVVEMDGNVVKVSVGSVEHPSTEEHYIAWVYLQTAHGGQRKAIKPGDKPEVSFALQDDELIAVYAYCNLHGLWKTEIKK